MDGVKKEFLTFCAIGGISTIINYAIFFFLYSLGIDYLVSAAAGYIIGVFFGFGLNSKFTFKSEGITAYGTVKYFLVYFFSLALGLSTLKFLVEHIAINPFAANILVLGVTTMTNFAGSKLFAFRKMTFPKIFQNRLFILVLILKIFFSIFFASHFLADGTIPFVNYFVSSGFSNPYSHFLELGLVKAFPYPPVMLAMVSAPFFLFSFLPKAIFENIFLQLLLSRIPLLIADLGIFFILTRLLKTREEKVLHYYWLSPIIFYIAYFHGQLDAIPIALLVFSIFLLLRGHCLKSAAVLGIAVAAKANILVALPFFFLYLWRNRETASRLLQYFSVSAAMYTAMVIPFVFSTGYRELVLNAAEQSWVFLFRIVFADSGFVIFVVPLVFVFFFLRMAYFRRITQDAFMMSFAIAFTLLVTLVPPMPGWFFWAVPFLVYFFAKDESVSKKHYFALNLAFLAYFLVFSVNSDIFSSMRFLAPGISTIPAPYFIIRGLGFDAALISNIAFSILAAVLLANIYFVYKFGLLANMRYRASGVLLGVAGDSGSGKSYFNNLVKDLVGGKNLTVLEGDDLHKWERKSSEWENKTPLNPKSNFLQREIEYIYGMAESRELRRREYDHDTGKFTPEKKVCQKKFILASGLHSFYLAKMRQILDLKVFLDPDASLRRHWKIMRDVKSRGYEKNAVLAALEKRQKDSGKFIEPQKRFADLVVSYAPAGKIKSPGSGSEKMPLCLLVSFGNSFDCNPLEEALALFAPKLAVETEYNDDLTTVAMKFSGAASLGVEETAKAAYRLVPDLEEMLENNAPSWRSNLDGCLQLVLLCMISEKLRNKRREDNAFSA